MQIRKFTKQDAKKLSELMQRNLLEVNSKDYSKSAIKALCDDYSPEKLITSQQKLMTFVGIDEEQIVGTVSLVGDRVSRMFVLPDYHGKGYGSLLLKHVEEIAKEKGIKSLRLRASVTAFEFYLKQGYRKVKEEEDEVLGPVIWMRKELG